MNKHLNVPEEDLNLNFDLNIEDITKAAEEAVIEKTTDEPEVDPSNFLEEVKETVKNEHSKSEKESDVVNKDNDKSSYDDQTYSAALELLAENNLLSLPEELGDVTEEKWNEIIHENRQRQKETLLEEVKNNAGDPRIAELLEYAYNGGDWYGVEEMQQTIQAEINLEQLDPTNEDDQRYLIESYLSEGLDPNNPVHALRLKNVPNEVDAYFERLEAEGIASQAKEFYTTQFEHQKELLNQQQAEYNYQQQLQAQQAKQEEEMWINTFKDTLNDRPWNKSKKDEIVKQFDIVTLEDGRETELWRYKFESIWNNPVATQVFLDFLSDYDHNNHQFTRNGVPSTKQASSTIQRIINSKRQNKPKGQYQSKRREVTNDTPQIDPRLF